VKLQLLTILSNPGLAPAPDTTSPQVVPTFLPGAVRRCGPKHLLLPSNSSIDLLAVMAEDTLQGPEVTATPQPSGRDMGRQLKDMVSPRTMLIMQRTIKANMPNNSFRNVIVKDF
jgi:hypothetical protein